MDIDLCGECKASRHDVQLLRRVQGTTYSWGLEKGAAKLQLQPCDAVAKARMSKCSRPVQAPAQAAAAGGPAPHHRHRNNTARPICRSGAGNAVAGLLRRHAPYAPFLIHKQGRQAPGQVEVDATLEASHHHLRPTHRRQQARGRYPAYRRARAPATRVRCATTTNTTTLGSTCTSLHTAILASVPPLQTCISPLLHASSKPFGTNPAGAATAAAPKLPTLAALLPLPPPPDLASCTAPTYFTVLCSTARRSYDSVTSPPSPMRPAAMAPLVSLWALVAQVTNPTLISSLHVRAVGPDLLGFRGHGRERERRRTKCPGGQHTHGSGGLSAPWRQRCFVGHCMVHARTRHAVRGLWHPSAHGACL